MGSRAWANHMRTHREREKIEHGTEEIQSIQNARETKKKNDMLHTYGGHIKYPIIRKKPRGLYDEKK